MEWTFHRIQSSLIRFYKSLAQDSLFRIYSHHITRVSIHFLPVVQQCLEEALNGFFPGRMVLLGQMRNLGYLVEW